MEAEHHTCRRLPCEHAAPDVFFAGARALEDATADTRFEDYTRGLVPELARVGDNGMSGDGPPHAKFGSEVAEGLFWRTCHRYCLHDRLNRDCLGCHAL